MGILRDFEKPPMMEHFHVLMSPGSRMAVGFGGPPKRLRFLAVGSPSEGNWDGVVFSFRHADKTSVKKEKY